MDAERQPASAQPGGEGGKAMISKFAIQNFKSLRDVHVDLETFTVFVGPNASGKSSILQGIDLLCYAFGQASESQPPTFVMHPGRMAHRDVDAEMLEAVSRGSKGPVELIAEAVGTRYCYRRSLPSPATLHLNPGTWDGSGFGIKPAQGTWQPWTPKPGTNPPLPLSVLLRLEASKLVQPAVHQGYPGADPTVMAPDGTGLHSALASMTLNDPDSWQALQQNLKQIIPTIRRLRHTKAAQMQQPTSLLFDTVGADSLPATQVSEGTLLVLGLLAALHASGRPNLLLLDDLDRGLHPKAQKELIIAASRRAKDEPRPANRRHHALALHARLHGGGRGPHDVPQGGRSTVCAPLTSHPKYPKWKDEMTPGEMWSLFGEKWVAEQEVKA